MPVRSAILGATLAMVVVVATIGFGASLNTLVSHPALYGWNWNTGVQRRRRPRHHSPAAGGRSPHRDHTVAASADSISPACRSTTRPSRCSG